MRHRFISTKRAWLLSAAALAMIGSSACDSAGGGALGGGDWLNPITGADGEKWTIRCMRSSAPEHEQICQKLADAMRRIKGLRADSVRIETDRLGSTIYYGEYRVKKAAGGARGFPDQMQKDIQLIRSLGLDRSMPFLAAVPEPLEEKAGSKEHVWHVSQAKGKYSLLVAVFYNTPTFEDRQEAAEQYVAQLREEGLAAYFYHEPVKSYVCVGDFNDEDLIEGPDGQQRYGPAVMDLINSRPNNEFRFMTENGFHRHYKDASGRTVRTSSQLIRTHPSSRTGLWGR